MAWCFSNRAPCSSSCCWKCFHARLFHVPTRATSGGCLALISEAIKDVEQTTFMQVTALPWHGRFTVLMTCGSSRPCWESVSSSSRHEMQVWKVKGSKSTWRRLNSWFSALALMSSRTRASTPVCHSGVSNNSIECSQCKLWLNKKCSGITGGLVAGSDCVWSRCSHII